MHLNLYNCKLQIITLENKLTVLLITRPPVYIVSSTPVLTLCTTISTTASSDLFSTSARFIAIFPWTPIVPFSWNMCRKLEKYILRQSCVWNIRELKKIGYTYVFLCGAKNIFLQFFFQEIEISHAQKILENFGIDRNDRKFLVTKIWKHLSNCQNIYWLKCWFMNTCYLLSMLLWCWWLWS